MGVFDNTNKLLFLRNILEVDNNPKHAIIMVR